ncbi:MAG TPA: Calx-beta domain-containing protein, partial [Flavobacterium sp.]|nr:Calx-beta domain-containing protein [Flavobacterium sp.]
MLKNYAQKGIMLFMFCMIAQFTGAQTLVHYWNFNTLPEGNVTEVSADFSIFEAETSITYPGTGDGYMDDVDGDILNAQNDDEAGVGLRVRNPSNTRDLLIAFPTTGYEDIMVKFATTKTNQGATDQIYSYSIDGGATYINTGLPVTTFNPVTDTYSLVTLDFSGIEGAEDNPNFIVKISFGGATASGDSGNNRFDNITVTSGISEEPPMTTVTFAEDFVVVNEDHGTLSFVLDIQNPVEGSVDVVLKTAPWSTATAGEDLTFSTTTIDITPESPATHTITIPVINDTDEEQQAEYFVLSLENPLNVDLTEDTLATIYIRDNDRVAPVPN